MSRTRVRSPVALLALVAYGCSACAPVVGKPQAPGRQPAVTTDVVYGHKDGLALTFDVHRPAQPNGAGVISIVSGGYQSSVEMGRLIAQGDYPSLERQGIHRIRRETGGHLALLLGTTADSGNSSASDTVLRESSRVAAVVAYFPPTDLTRWGTQRIRQAFAAMRLTEAQAAEWIARSCVGCGILASRRRAPSPLGSGVLSGDFGPPAT